MNTMAESETLTKLSALLPHGLVKVRWGNVTCPCTKPYVESLLASALKHGHLIDRTNGDGPLECWDGWLVIQAPTEQIFIETFHAAKEKRPLISENRSGDAQTNQVLNSPIAAQA